MKKGIKVSMKTRELSEKSIVWQERKKSALKRIFLVIGVWKRSEDHDIAETAVIFNN